jgi:hypothetical protein
MRQGHDAGGCGTGGGERMRVAWVHADRGRGRGVGAGVLRGGLRGGVSDDLPPAPAYLSCTFTASGIVHVRSAVRSPTTRRDSRAGSAHVSREPSAVRTFASSATAAATWTSFQSSTTTHPKNLTWVGPLPASPTPWSAEPPGCRQQTLNPMSMGRQTPVIIEAPAQQEND